jgi:hypothetical protein
MPPRTHRLVVGGGHAAHAGTSLMCVAAWAAANEFNGDHAVHFSFEARRLQATSFHYLMTFISFIEMSLSVHFVVTTTLLSTIKPFAHF